MSSTKTIRPPPLKLKAKKPFPPYDEGCEKVQVEMKKKEKRDSMEKLRSSWKKFSMDIQTPTSQVKASGATINGYPMNASQVTFLADTYELRLRDHTHYWYDKESGFFGKVGGLCQRHIDPRLRIRGSLDARSSGGDTGIFVNGREISVDERKNWKRSGMVLDPKHRYSVDPLGNVCDEASGTILFNWRQKYGDMQKQQLAIGATVVGFALLGGMAGGGGEGLLFGGGEESILGGDVGGSGGGDGFYASDITGAASNFDSSGAGYVCFDDGSSVSIGL